MLNVLTLKTLDSPITIIKATKEQVPFQELIFSAQTMKLSMDLFHTIPLKKPEFTPEKPLLLLLSKETKSTIKLRLTLRATQLRSNLKLSKLNPSSSQLMLMISKVKKLPWIWRPTLTITLLSTLIPMVLNFKEESWITEPHGIWKFYNLSQETTIQSMSWLELKMLLPRLKPLF
jgi:hypothetical protein